MSFIKKFKLLCDKQFGFQSNKNRADALLEYMDNTYDAFNDSNSILEYF